jgi:hypothetical protein
MLLRAEPKGARHEAHDNSLILHGLRPRSSRRFCHWEDQRTQRDHQGSHVARERRGWVGLPGKPQLRDGAPIPDDRSKIQYTPVIEIDRREVRDAFGAKVWQAALQRFPEIGAPEVTP